MPKKAFAPKKAPPVTETALEVPSRDRQFAVGGTRTTKQPTTYKLSTSVRDRVELKATELTHSLGRKVWPAHVAEAALAAFLALDVGQQLELLER